MINVVTSKGRFAFNRAVPLGYVFYGDSTFSLVSYDDTEIVVAQVAFNGYYHFVHHPYFVAPSTNQYTLDHCIDFASSFSLIGGSPFTITVNLGWLYLPGEFSPRIAIDFGVGFTTVLTVPLAAAASPWYTRP